MKLIVFGLFFAGVLVTNVLSVTEEIAAAGEPFELTCPLIRNASMTLKWYHGNAEIATDDKEGYTVNDNNNTLFIQSFGKKHLGEYVCSYLLANNINQTGVIIVNAPPHVEKYDKAKNLVQGDPLVLTCKAWGSVPISVTWYHEQTPLDPSDERFKFKNESDLVNSSVRIENIDYPDGGAYTCVATNSYGMSNATLEVKVKDKLAALWPFLGICAEVAILCAIIFIYERRRAKKIEEEERKEEEAAQALTSNDHKQTEDVRHRK